MSNLNKNSYQASWIANTGNDATPFSKENNLAYILSPQITIYRAGDFYRTVAQTNVGADIIRPKQVAIL